MGAAPALRIHLSTCNLKGNLILQSTPGTQHRLPAKWPITLELSSLRSLFIYRAGRVCAQWTQGNFTNHLSISCCWQSPVRRGKIPRSLSHALLWGLRLPCRHRWLWDTRQRHPHADRALGHGTPRFANVWASMIAILAICFSSDAPRAKLSVFWSADPTNSTEIQGETNSKSSPHRPVQTKQTTARIPNSNWPSMSNLKHFDPNKNTA